MAEVFQTLGIIAGNGAYPRTFAREARRAGVERLVAAAFKGETEEDLVSMVDSLDWFRVGQLGKLIRFFKKEGVGKAVMVGQIAPRNLFDVIPDLRTINLLRKLKTKNAESIFGSIADELASDGIELIPATTYLDDYLPAAGHVHGPPLDESGLADADYGFGIAKEVSRLDIGQTVVVKNGTVLAVEAFEGTNEAMKRGGKLGKGKAVMVKVSKPRQDLRFDVPVVGPLTVEAAAEAGVRAIIIEAGSTLLLESERVAELCRAHKITIQAVDNLQTDG
ncbi:MAG: UDP-2,3-diacylglucosamine diphosphatase LpxI [Verrucomicrobiota bacterium]